MNGELPPIVGQAAGAPLLGDYLVSEGRQFISGLSSAVQKWARPFFARALDRDNSLLEVIHSFQQRVADFQSQPTEDGHPRPTGFHHYAVLTGTRFGAITGSAEGGLTGTRRGKTRKGRMTASTSP